ncbi:hypothetical protein AYK26_05455 [Euryarchaeota archaeon SM23-78]|nr:MAG: hypothetical protein AYK26_05455 [Euryarchaeota archaeon SM23-78]MBW3001491.1 hypothetical protein [Candidatus Woesearchaeota archaeon]
MKLTFEFKELIKAWAAISIAFGILMYVYYDVVLGLGIIIAALTVGLGFIVHELAHRYFARKFGKHAEFRANNMMLIIAILMSLLGVVIAAPGAVIISGFVSKRQGGIIASAGPAANLLLALVFLPLIFVIPEIAFYGLMINAWLALFNLIPFRGFDGHRILEWNKLTYLGLIVAAIIMNLFHIITYNFTSMIG